MMASLEAIRADLAAEHEALDALVEPLANLEWDLPTPSDPWTIRDQISHLAFFDEQATLAVVDPDAFHGSLGSIPDAESFMNAPLERGRAMKPREVLSWWRDARTRMNQAFSVLDPDGRVPWYGPPMSPASFMTARIMETWAHGQDVADALDIRRHPTPRLRHIAHLGVRARPFSYRAHGMEPPTEDVRVELTGPDGERWIWNESARDVVAGDALEFCLVVTQRRHFDDTDLLAGGALAREWMGIAQAFAGPPGAGRRPGQFRKAGW